MSKSCKMSFENRETSTCVLAICRSYFLQIYIDSMHKMAEILQFGQKNKDISRSFTWKEIGIFRLASQNRNVQPIPWSSMKMSLTSLLETVNLISPFLDIQCFIFKMIDDPRTIRVVNNEHFQLYANFHLLMIYDIFIFNYHHYISVS